jgi:hypothetical protein
MIREEFIRALEKGGIAFTYSEGGERIVIVRENLVINLKDLGITSLPPNITFDNLGFVNLGEVSQLPEGLIFDINDGGVIGEKITRIPRGTKFGKGVKAVLIKSGSIYFHNVEGINYGDLLTATFKYI